MSTFQIIMIIFMAIFAAVLIGFAIAFIVEAVKSSESKAATKASNDKPEQITHEYDIREMLAQLEEEAANAKNVQEEPEVKEVAGPEPEVVEEVPEEVVKEEQPAEEPVVEAKAEPVEEVVDEPAIQEETTEEVAKEEPEDEPKKNKTVVIKEVTTETIGTDFDYNVRLAKIVESKNKLESDIQKTKRAILKYERTERRRARNQKMLDRRAVELTNLNLLMYSVTDIKNVDADKKTKQEELTKHIAELKASIQDAEEFLAKNKEKYEHDKKMYAFYTKEETRYNDEIKELEILIKNTNSVTGSTTTTTTTTTEE